LLLLYAAADLVRPVLTFRFDFLHNKSGRIWHWRIPAYKDALADAGQDGWRGAVTASSAALGALFLLLIAVVAALRAPSPARENHILTSGPNDFVGRLRVDFVPARDAYHGRGV
jgi:hypothetical protein